ncbi:transposase [Kitasatospora sp. NPDC056531]|uniref:transposase n=1 Tax=Kitasatospora sp. NPDC056531 TaxID=3345856 RepID=UPI0036C08E48
MLRPVDLGEAERLRGGLGARSLCRVRVSVHVVADRASSPLSWRLFVRSDWDDRDGDRGRRTGLPPEVGHVEKWRLAIDTLEELIAWGACPAGCGRRRRLRPVGRCRAQCERRRHLGAGRWPGADHEVLASADSFDQQAAVRDRAAVRQAQLERRIALGRGVSCPWWTGIAKGRIRTVWQGVGVPALQEPRRTTPDLGRR